MTLRLTQTAAVRRRAFSIRQVLVALVLAGGLPATGFVIWPQISRSTDDAGPMMYRVERGDFVHEITDRGNVESANNVEIRCEVKARNSAGTTILDIVPEGTMVQPGDVLIKLDSSALEIDRTTQMIVCSNSKAALIQAQKAYDTAIITKKEYMEGQHQQLVQTAENEQFIAKEDLSRAKEYAAYSERLAAKGYITTQQLEADRFAVEKTKKAVEIAETKLDVLTRFTKEKMLTQLESDIRTTEAKLEAQTASHKLEMGHLSWIEGQLEKCVIKSPQAGQVVYANVTGYHGSKEVIIDVGEVVRERQVLIYLPDTKRMQVVARINEGKVALVSHGMPAKIRLDAFPDMELTGKVERVDEFPAPNSFMGSSVKEYETIVSIDEAPPGLRPGLTAEVRIRAEQKPNVVQVPVQAVFQHGEKYYCVTREGSRYFAREVAIGSSNDKTIVIRGGLSEGERVVLNATAYREKVKLPSLPAEEQRMVARADRERDESANDVVPNASRIRDPLPRPDNLVKKDGGRLEPGAKL
jgi:HlyD family secretion protein